MAIEDLIADFLKTHNYGETLEAFSREYGRPFAEEVPETLEQMVKDRFESIGASESFDHSKLDLPIDGDLKRLIDEQLWEWDTPYHREKLTLQGDIDGLVISCCILRGHQNLLLAATSKSHLYVIDTDSGKIVAFMQRLISTPIKSMISSVDNLIVLAGMDGKLYLGLVHVANEITVQISSLIQAHRRLITDVKSIDANGKTLVLTSGFDVPVKCFELKAGSNHVSSLNHVADVHSNGLSSSFDVCNYNNSIVVVLGKVDNTSLEVYALKNLEAFVLKYKISLNDAEYSFSSFTPRYISICSQGPTPLIAVGTSHEPYMRLIIVSLKDFNLPPSTPVARNQILFNINTLSPQDKFSQPLLSWNITSPKDQRNSKSRGVWIMGDDGIIRGIDLVHQGPVVELQGHTQRIKCFSVNSSKLITCGSDNLMAIWHAN